MDGAANRVKKVCSIALDLQLEHSIGDQGDDRARGVQESSTPSQGLGGLAKLPGSGWRGWDRPGWSQAGLSDVG